MPPLYPKRSVPVVRRLIEDAVKPNYSGTDGLASMLSNILDIAADRGLMNAADLTALAQLGGVDGALAIVPGVAIYKFTPSSIVALPDTDIRGVGGTWQYIAAVSPAPYRRVIGDGTVSVFTITHNLNTLWPTVSVFNTLGGLPYELTTNYTLSVTDANTIVITSLAVWGGDSQTVVVKK